MSYQVLARKWRPRNFDEVTGQEHVTTALRNAIRTDRVPHAVLLTGPRGVGKTTLARILARCLNCDKGPTGEACGECSPCLEIAAGTSTDVQEIDAASRTSVDDVRELIEAVRYAPSPGKYRIFVVDEVHMLSTAAFNALLKTLEEPPPRSLFVFATTNPEKIPHTVISRCQRYDLRRIPSSQVVERLEQIARAEGIDVSEASLLAIAREGEGSLRDSMTLLDQLVAYGGGKLDDARVAEVLDLVDRRLLLGIAAACIDGDPASALEACGRAAEAGVDPRRLGGALLQTLRDLTVLRVAPEATGLVEASDAEIAELTELAGRTEALRLRRMFRALMKEQEDLAWAPQPFAVLEMAVVRLATLAGEDVAQLLARLDALERSLSGSGAGTGPDRGGSASGSSRSSKESRRSGPPVRSPSASARPAGPSAPGPEPATPSPPAEGEEAAALSPPAFAPTPGATVDAEAEAPLPVLFDRLRAFAEQTDRGLAASLQEGELLERTPNRLRIRVVDSFTARRLESRVQELEAIAARFFGTPVSVAIERAEARIAQRGTGAPDEETLRLTRQKALEHPALNVAREILGGEIVEIHPLGDAP